MSRKYKYGMYGGKFMPFHKGHLHCLEKASEECENVYCVLVIGGADERRILTTRDDAFLKPEAREKHIREICSERFDNVKLVVADVSTCIKEDGSDDWDAETPIMTEACEGNILDAVYGSEPSYEKYFKKAYPTAEYILVDVDRKEVPISATKIRSMSEKEREDWIV